MKRIIGLQATLGVAIAAALALGGCSFGRPSQATSPRAQAQGAGGGSSLEALRQENEALKQEQLQNSRQIEALQKQLAAQEADQKRFRQMMSTNFDLLEQSVALTLSKSIDGNGKGTATAQAAPDSKSTAAKSKTAIAAPAPVSAPAAMKPTADEVSPPQEMPASDKGTPAESSPKATGQSSTPFVVAMSGNGSGQPRMTPPGTASGTQAVVPVVAMQEPAPINDPDLTPPKHPKVLTANRAAKALYERGFALYANREYDQAILVYQNFLSRYPTDIYSDNAQFWIGESYLHMNKLADAETAYRKVLREYDHKNSLEGYKTPEAIYRLGTLAQRRNNPRLARYYYANVAQRFPESSAGRKAQRELEGKPEATAQNDDD